ncbi:MAG: hypothetical protein US35_C0027G0012 [Parcubacteria group bacterium GW2011_GWA2_37_10]|nr:MAG: hypothetical protein US35_C0027G0012 [Parcubacteria group bacterium GW2011_GWA2_37_10]
MNSSPELKNPKPETKSSAIEVMQKATALTPEQVEKLREIQRGENPDKVVAKKEALNPPEVKTEQQVRVETFDARKKPVLEFLEYFVRDGKNTLKKNVVDGVKDFLEGKIKEAKEAIESIRKTGNIELGIKIIGELMAERSKSLEEPEVSFADRDERFCDYIKSTIANAAQKAKRNVVVLSPEETEMFERYLNAAQSKISKAGKNRNREKVEKLLEEVKMLKETYSLFQKRQEAPDATPPEGTEKNATGDPKMDINPPPPIFITQEATAQSSLNLDFDPIVIGAGETVDQRFGETQIVSKPEVTGVPSGEPIPDAIANLEPEKEMESPVEKWNELIASQKEIIRKILDGELSKEDGEKQKKELSREIIKQGCAITGEDIKTAEDDIKSREDAQWQTSVLSQFPNFNGDINGYKAWQERSFANDKNVVLEWCKGVINGQNNLSPEQRTSLLEKGEIGIGKRIVLEKEDAAVLIKAGIDITKMERGGWFGLGVDFTIDKKHFDNINQLNNFIAEEKEKYIKKEFEEKYNERKKSDIDQFIEQYVLDQKINELYDGFPKISEESKKVIDTFGGKLETPEQMLKTLGILQNEENRYRELASKIDAAKRPASKQKALKAIETRREEHKKLAKAMMELASRISGRDIRSEAEEKVKKDFPGIEESKKKRLIGNAIYKIIEEIAEPFRKLSQKEKNELDVSYPFFENKEK